MPDATPRRIFENLEDGMTIDEVLEQFPVLPAIAAAVASSTPGNFAEVEIPVDLSWESAGTPNRQ